MTAIFSFGSGVAAVLGRHPRLRRSAVSTSMMQALLGLAGDDRIVLGRRPCGGSRSVVMSSLPLRFLASWQAKQFSLRIGATSLMKLTSALPFGSSASAEQAGNAAQTATRIAMDRNMRQATPMAGGRNMPVGKVNRTHYKAGADLPGEPKPV